MNWLDICIIVPLVWFGYKGLRRGLVLELASLIGLIVGIYVAIHFSFFTEDLLRDTFNLTGKYMPVVSFIITLVVVILVIYLIGKVIEKLIDLVALGFFNKLLGLVFGILKAALLVSVLLFVIDSFDTNERLIKPHVKESSLLYPPISKIIPTIIPWIDLEKFRGKKEQIKEALPEV